MKIITITGTKGKTTITRALSHIIHEMGETTLRVDTDGHYIKEEQRSTLEDSKKLFSLVPTVCPGKYLLDMREHYPDFTAVFEAAIGSSGKAGIGYGLHQIGVFANVLEDHLGVTERLKTRMDIAKAKRFVFTAIDKGGYLVFNADDRYVCSQLKYIPEFRQAKLLPAGNSFKYFDLPAHLRNGGEYITVEDNMIVVKSTDHASLLIDVRNVGWTFNGLLKPSVYNLMFIMGALYAYTNGNITPEVVRSVEKYKLDEYGGRLTLLENEQRVKILVDYAHEKYSLLEVASLGRKLKNKKKLIGIVRLAPDRTNKMIQDTGKAIANAFDSLIVYDKIDGIDRKRYEGTKTNIVREAGEVSQLLFDSIKDNKRNKQVERFLPEQDAVRRAAQIAKPGDFVVVICGDDHKRTVEYIKKYFEADFI